MSSGVPINLSKTTLSRQPCKNIGDFGPFATDVCYSDLYVEKTADQKTIAAGQA